MLAENILFPPIQVEQVSNNDGLRLPTEFWHTSASSEGWHVQWETVPPGKKLAPRSLSHINGGNEVDEAD